MPPDKSKSECKWASGGAGEIWWHTFRSVLQFQSQHVGENASLDWMEWNPVGRMRFMWQLRGILLFNYSSWSTWTTTWVVQLRLSSRRWLSRQAVVALKERMTRQLWMELLPNQQTRRRSSSWLRWRVIQVDFVVVLEEQARLLLRELLVLMWLKSFWSASRWNGAWAWVT